MKVEVKNVKKYFGTTHAVDGVSFETGEGRIFGLLGPNGAGKSTTIRMIMNILAPDEGEILFNGQHISPKDKNRIGYLPEERGLYKKMVVNDLLLYFSSLKGKTGIEAQKSINVWLERFDLSDWQKKKVDELSKGMSQKIQFIVSIAHDPEIIFLDEPFAGLDPVSTEILLDSILDLRRKGKTILLSTHIMDQAEKLCNDILILDYGREVISGPVEDIKAKVGKNSVHIEFDGSIDFLKDTGIVADITTYPRWIEADLAEGKTADELFQALAGRISVKKFEVMAPSLHKIFVDIVGKKVVSDE